MQSPSPMYSWQCSWGLNAAKIVQGLFGFEQSQYAGEEAQRVSATIVRSRGLFGPVTVFWAVDNTYAAQIDGPLNGSVHFIDGQTSATVDFLIAQDENPEARVDIPVFLEGTSKGLLFIPNQGGTILSIAENVRST